MPKNNVVFRLVRYDEVIVIAPDRHLSTSSISTRLEDLVGNYRHDAPPQLLYRTSPKGCGRSSLRVKGALSYPQPGLAETAAANPRVGAVRERIATNVYLGGLRDIAKGWADRKSEASNAEQLSLTRGTSADAHKANISAIVALTIASVSMIMGIAGVLISVIALRSHP
jgi:hypothetical protein